MKSSDKFLVYFTGFLGTMLVAFMFTVVYGIVSRPVESTVLVENITNPPVVEKSFTEEPIVPVVEPDPVKSVDDTEEEEPKKDLPPEDYAKNYEEWEKLYDFESNEQKSNSREVYEKVKDNPFFADNGETIIATARVGSTVVVSTRSTGGTKRDYLCDWTDISRGYFSPVSRRFK